MAIGKHDKFEFTGIGNIDTRILLSKGVHSPANVKHLKLHFGKGNVNIAVAANVAAQKDAQQNSALKQPCKASQPIIHDGLLAVLQETHQAQLLCDAAKVRVLHTLSQLRQSQN